MASNKRTNAIPACALATVLALGQLPATALAAQEDSDANATATASETSSTSVASSDSSSTATAAASDASATSSDSETASASVAETASASATESATAFTFSDDGISVEEGDSTGYKVSGTALTINEAGTYVVSGSCADGSIKVKKGTTGVTIVLDGLTLTSSTTAPLTCNKSTGVTVVAAAGTVNTLTDAAENNDDNYPDNADAENAVIKCKDGSQVELTGAGTLNVVANGKNGVKSGATTDEEGEASLTISNLTLNITASVNDAINAEQTLDIESGTVTVSAADDGIHSDYVLNVGAEGTAGPVVNVKESYEGLEAASLNIYSGEISILSSDDCMNAANSDLTDYAFEMNIAGGTIYAYSTEGDGFDSNGTLTFTGGTTEVWTANAADNQPLDSDGTLTIDGGTVFAAGGSSGMGETISGTQTFVMFGGTGQGGQGGQQPGQGGQDGQQPGQPGEQGGNGGQGGQQPSDQNDSTNQDGSQTPPDQPSGQPGQQGGNQGGASIVSAGEAVSVVDASGNVLYSATAPCAASYAFFSSSDVTEGSTYTLTAAGEDAATGTAGENSGNNQPGQPGDNQPEQPGGDNQPGQPGGMQAFTDVTPDAWYAQAAQFCAQKGLITGYSNTTLFGPLDSLTRAQLVTILWRAACPDESAAYTGSAENGTEWTDVSANEFYTAAANWAYENGVVNGYVNTDGSTSFAPDDTVTFEQMVTILANFAAANGTDTKSADASVLADFTDASSVATWATGSMAWAVENGLVHGYDNTDGTRSLVPGEDIIRGRAAVVLMNACNLGVIA